jgi:RimJ/RimL family protein N-acetyltransferase
VSVILHALLLDVPEVVDTERLTLRATRAGCGAAMHAAVMESLEELRVWMPWARAPRSLDTAEARCREATAKWHAREELDFCFFSKADGELVGTGGLHTIDWTLPRFEIGYWVRTPCRGKGLATEATRALADMARGALGAVRLEITSDARNTASRKVAEKAGFELEGIRRKSRRDVGGELADSCMYARVF